MAISAIPFAALGLQGLGLLTGVALAGGIASAAFNFSQIRRFKRMANLPRFRLEGDDGRILQLSHLDATGAALIADKATGAWSLRINARPSSVADDKRARFYHKNPVSYDFERIVLRGDSAKRALAMALPFINEDGASKQSVRAAIDEIGKWSDLDEFLRHAARIRQYTNAVPGENSLAGLTKPMRLALEMTLHENDEESALAGQLADLEKRWREAEEIAAIADAMLIPDSVEKKLQQMKEPQS